MRVLALLSVVLVLLGCAALALGERSLTVNTLIAALFGPAAPDPAHAIVWQLRLPRLATAVLVGAALGAGGAVTQAIMRNPLAEPGLIGINAGAALAATLVIVEIGALPERLLPVFTFAGALALSALVYALAWREGASSLRIILIGIGLSSFAGALASLIATFGDVADVQRAMVWLAGSLSGARWDRLPALLVWVLSGLLLVWALSRELDLAAMGDEIARARGQRINLVRAGAMVAVAMLCGAAVAASGLIAFVGLAAPHLARGLVGRSHATLLPGSALIGACLVVAADLIARRAIAPAQLPVGVVTALLGAPFFAILLWGRRDE